MPSHHHLELVTQVADDLRSTLPLDDDGASPGGSPGALPFTDVLRLERAGRGVIVVSDLHLGLQPPLGFPRELEPVLATLIAEGARRGDIIVLAGDILDGGARARDAAGILHLHPRLEEALALAATSTDLVYVPGNHDPPLHELQTTLGWQLASRLVLDDSILVVHGDELDEGLRSTFVGQLGDVLLRAQQLAGARLDDGPVGPHGSLASRVLAGVALEAGLLAHRHVRDPDISRFVDENLDYLVSMEEERDPRFVLRALKSLALPPSVRTLICGHTHHPGTAQVGDVKYVNAGTWSRRFATAVLIDGDRCEVRDIVTGRSFGEEAYADHENPSRWRDFADGAGRELRLANAVRHAVSGVVGRAGEVRTDARRAASAVFGTLPRLTRHAPPSHAPTGRRGDAASDRDSGPMAVSFRERLEGNVRLFSEPARSHAVTIDLQASLAPSDRQRRASVVGTIVIAGLTDGPVQGSLTFETGGGGSLAYELSFEGHDGVEHRLFGRKLVRFADLARSLTELPAALTRDGEPLGEAELVFDARRQLGAFIRSIAVVGPHVRTFARRPAEWADACGRPIGVLEPAARRRVVVTGATGHLGHNLVAQLLLRGHHVTAVVRRLREDSRVAALRALAARHGASGAPGELSLVEADLLSPAQVRRAFECSPDLVFHTASTFQLVGTDEERTVFEPTVLAASHVLRESARARVKRVVMTSSVAALGTDASGREPLHEGDWNVTSENAYHRAKTVAERRAWELAGKEGLDLVVIHPASFLGPNCFRHTPTTRVLADLVSGRTPVVPPFALSWVDVRDVAWAHLLAAENPTANGRYVVAAAYLSFEELVRRFLDLDPHLQVPTRRLPPALASLTPAIDWARSRVLGAARSVSRSVLADIGGKETRYSSARAERELGWTPLTLERSLGDTLEWLKEQYES